jgi:hypothetical protein
LILLSAAGVKIRERKNAAAARHAMRAAALLRQLMKAPDRAFERALGMSPAALAECAEGATRIPADLKATAPGEPQPVFNFILGPSSRGGRADRKTGTVTCRRRYEFDTATLSADIGFGSRPAIPAESPPLRRRVRNPNLNPMAAINQFGLGLHFAHRF